MPGRVEDQACVVDAHDLIARRVQHEQGTVQFPQADLLRLGADVIEEASAHPEGAPPKSDVRLA